MELREAELVELTFGGAVPFSLCEIFSTPYTDEEVARGSGAVEHLQGVVVEVAHCIRIPRQEYEDYVRQWSAADQQRYPSPTSEIRRSATSFQVKVLR